MNEMDKIELISEGDGEMELDLAIDAQEQEPDEMEFLRAQIENLKAEITRRDEQERANARIISELNELEQYFPEVEISEIPEEVWNKVRCGASLSAAYALFRRKSELKKRKASDFNEKNRRMSAGSLLRGDGEKYFSPSEVKKMSPAQVKKNYDDIIESMRHWN